jgi:hypothetical protein
VILACASISGAQTERRQVMLLYSYDRDFASHNAFATMFRPELRRAFGEPIDFIEVSLQAARLNPSASEKSILNQVRSTLPHRRLDLVVPIGGPAAVFAQTFRQQLFPTTPMLLAGVDRRFVRNTALAANDTAVAVEHDPPQMIETILRLLPDTRTVFVVIGASRLEQFWLREVKRGLRRFEGRLTFIWTNELSFEGMLKDGASLPPQSAIFYGVLSSDAKGVRYGEERTLGAFHAAANAPIFGFDSTQLGRGIVGGPLLSIEDLSRNTATVAVRMLRGAEPVEDAVDLLVEERLDRLGQVLVVEDLVTLRVDRLALLVDDIVELDDGTLGRALAPSDDPERPHVELLTAVGGAPLLIDALDFVAFRTGSIEEPFGFGV